MKLATRTIQTTHTKYRSILDDKVVKGWPPGSISQSQVTELEGEVTLEVDVEALLQMLGWKALTAKGHKAVEASGAVVVTARVTSSKPGEWNNYKL